MEELISVIVPVFNCINFIEKCIQSILGQTYKNIELILVDDGSTDGSEKICDNYARKDKRIKVIHKKNSGVSSSRNEGIKIAKGMWYSFVDADDYLDEDMYELLINLYSKTGAEIVQCGYRRIEKGKTNEQSNTGTEYIFYTDEAIKNLINGKLFGNALWNKIYRNNVILNINFDENLKINEDVLFNFEVFSNAKKIAYIDVAKYNYNVHETSTCFVIEDEKKLKDVCTVSRYILNHLKNDINIGTARTRYVGMLILYFRFCYKNRKEQKYLITEITIEIFKQISYGDITSRNILISGKLIYFSPSLYYWLHKIYEKLKKPNWQ